MGVFTFIPTWVIQDGIVYLFAIVTTLFIVKHEKHPASVILEFFCFVLLYAAYAMFTGFAKLREGIEAFHWAAFAAACGLAFGNYVLRFFKWEYYLARLEIRGVPKLDSFLTFLSGFVLTRLSLTTGRTDILVRGLIKRWPRLAGPALIAVLGSWLLFAAGGYFYAPAAAITGSSWFARFAGAR